MRDRGHGRGSWNWLMDSRSIPTTTTLSSVGAPGKSASVARRWKPPNTSAESPAHATPVTTTVSRRIDTRRRINTLRFTT